MSPGERGELNNAMATTPAKAGGKKKRRNARKEKLEALRTEEAFLERENEILERAIASVMTLPAARDIYRGARGDGSDHGSADSD